MEYWIVLLSFSLPAGIVILIFSAIGYKKNGVWFWTKMHIMSKGNRSTAIILDTIDKPTNLSINGSLQYIFTVVLEVHDPISGTDFKVKRKYMDSWYSVLKDKNAEVPVVIHPTESEIVLVDFKTLRKNRREKMKQREESDEERLDRLMNS